MIAFLRVVGVLNAAVWFGSAIFFTFGVGPAFFSAEMKALLGRPYAGAAAQIVIERYFTLHYICGLAALAHLLVEGLYTGRPLPKVILSLIAALLLLGLLEGELLEPKLKQLHRQMFVTPRGLVLQPVTPEQVAAAKSFRIWHGVAQSVNLVVLVGLLLYLGRATDSFGSSRWFGTARSRG